MGMIVPVKREVEGLSDSWNGDRSIFGSVPMANVTKEAKRNAVTDTRLVNCDRLAKGRSALKLCKQVKSKDTVSANLRKYSGRLAVLIH
jgi:hypothetical protein